MSHIYKQKHYVSNKKYIFISNNVYCISLIHYIILKNNNSNIIKIIGRFLKLYIIIFYIT